VIFWLLPLGAFKWEEISAVFMTIREENIDSRKKSKNQLSQLWDHEQCPCIRWQKTDRMWPVQARAPIAWGSGRASAQSGICPFPEIGYSLAGGFFLHVLHVQRTDAFCCNKFGRAQEWGTDGCSDRCGKASGAGCSVWDSRNSYIFDPSQGKRMGSFYG
jgi:hypothetical protein